MRYYFSDNLMIHRVREALLIWAFFICNEGKECLENDFFYRVCKLFLCALDDNDNSTFHTVILANRKITRTTFFGKYTNVMFTDIAAFPLFSGMISFTHQ